MVQANCLNCILYQPFSKLKTNPKNAAQYNPKEIAPCLEAIKANQVGPE